MKNISNMLWGIIFIALGLILSLNVLGVTDINVFFRGWWSLFIIVPSFIDLFNKKSNKFDCFICFIIGIALLLSANGILDFGLICRLIVPFIILCLGFSLIFKDQINKKVRKEIKKIKNDTDENYFAAFGAQNIDLGDQAFDGGNVTAVFGGIKLDLTKAKITSDLVIESNAIFGGITIILPDSVNVKVSSLPVFGGVDNSHQGKNDAKVTVYIKSTCLFGGLNIK